jgi:signal transduction histidine kinase
MDQALSNILGNVAVHTPPGTPVMIVGRIEDGTVRVEVSDAGPGIPEEDRERVFVKFQRLADDSFGTGLGLAIARAATSAQGGSLTIEDSSLGGARFVLLLPNLATGGASGAK